MGRKQQKTRRRHRRLVKERKMARQVARKKP